MEEALAQMVFSYARMLLRKNVILRKQQLVSTNCYEKTIDSFLWRGIIKVTNKVSHQSYNPNIVNEELIEIFLTAAMESSKINEVIARAFC